MEVYVSVLRYSLRSEKIKQLIIALAVQRLVADGRGATRSSWQLWPTPSIQFYLESTKSQQQSSHGASYRNFIALEQYRENPHTSKQWEGKTPC